MREELEEKLNAIVCEGYLSIEDYEELLNQTQLREQIAFDIQSAILTGTLEITGAEYEVAEKVLKFSADIARGNK